MTASVRDVERPGTRSPALLVAWALAGAAVLTQMAFPFTGGGTVPLTVTSVLLLAGAALVHAGATLGPRAAATLLVVASGGGLLAESVGVATGFPFGAYAYTGSLGLSLLGVPLLVPLAWTMMAWPALVVGRLLTAGRSRVLTVLVAAWALATWDVFLDPQMVDAGHWRWAHPTPALPGVEGIPLTNYAGWLLVALALCTALELALPRRTDDALPVAVYLWTYASSVLAHAAFFGRPSVALVGGLLMGTVAVPLALAVRRRGRR